MNIECRRIEFCQFYKNGLSDTRRKRLRRASDIHSASGGSFVISH
jgi:hypothetical protein